MSTYLVLESIFKHFIKIKRSVVDILFNSLFQLSVNVCQHVNTDSIEVKAGHREIIYFGAPGKCIIDIQVTTERFSRRQYFQSTYLLDLLNHYTPTRSLRSSQLLLQTNPNGIVLSQRGFSSSAPCPSLFHSRLKTYLFNKSFPP